MRKILILLLLAFPAVSFAQTANFEDDFEDEDISDWSGDTNDFTFIQETENTLLKQDAPDAGTSYLSIPSTDVEGYWEFFIRLEGFAPSDGNKADIYLMSDAEDLTGSLNGYMLQAGENLSGDVFRLFKITAGAKDGEILTGITDISSGGDFRVKITRDGFGNWTLEVGTGYAGALNEEDTGTENTYTTATHFGFKTVYSSTRSDKFAFDFKIDIPPIEVSSISTVNDTEVDITFSRDIDFGTVQTSDFTLNPGNNTPQSVIQQSTDVARLTFSSSIPSGENELTVTDINDANGETTLADTALSFFIFDEYQPGDIVINEFLKDPPTGTTEEYVELKNTSNRYLNLRDWQVGDDNSLTTISSFDFAILPDSFAVITPDTAALSAIFGNVNYTQASLPSLNNTTSDQVRVYNKNGDMVDSLEYTPDWGGVDVALERRDASVSSTFQENWGDSPADDFGTPGFSNQVQPDVTPPEIEELAIRDNQTLHLVVSERLEYSSTETISNYTLSQNPEPDATTPPLPSITSAVQIAADTVELTLDAELEEYNGTWTLTADNLTDIFGNTNNEEIEFEYYVIFTAEAGQVAINEFMYDPASGLSEFVELYNHSDSSFNLQDWTLSDNRNDPATITGSSFLLPRGEYAVLVPDNTLEEDFPDASFIVMGSRFPALNNDTDAIVIRNQNGTLIDSLTYTDDWGGSEISLERRTVEFPATFRENWGDSPSPNLATPGLPNEIQPDNSPPEIINIERNTSDQIRLTFSERLQEGPAENTGNFSLSADNIGNPPALQSATLSSSTTILLQYDTDFPNQPDGTTYELSVTNQTDIFGNTAGELTESFFVIEYTEADSGEVFVTEFMYNPADGFTDFIELYNPTQNAYNLEGWTYNDDAGNRRVISNNEFALGPESRIILAPDSTILSSFPGITLIAMGSRFANLNSTTPDAIVIRTQDGTLIDSLRYNPDWGGNEISLERRSIDFSPIFQENWGDSPSPNLATPGQENEIEEDDNPPVLENAFISAADSIRIIFNERVDSIIANNTANYSISPSVSVAEINRYQGNALTIALGSALTDGETYTITIQNQEDIFGNVQPSVSVDLEYTLISSSTPGDVIVNEILYRRKSAESEEFIELYNRSESNFDLTNWTLSDATGSTDMPGGTQIRSGEYLILTDSESFADEFGNDNPAKASMMKSQSGNAVYVSGFPSLNDDEDAVVIKNENGIAIDSLFYNETWGGNEPGVSLERKDPISASNDASNWASSTAPNGNSAGSQSSVFQPDETPPEIIFSKLQPDGKIYVAFSEFVNIDNAEVLVNDEPTIISEHNEADGNIVILGDQGFPSGEPLSVFFTDVTDFRGNANDNLSVEVSQPLAAGSVVINEILFDPLANSDDNLPDQTEYIELYNRSDYAISLEGLFIHDEPDEDDEVRSIFPVSSQFKWIPAGGYVLFYAENQATSFGKSQLAEYFEMENEDDQFYIRTDRSSLSLASSGDAVFLVDSTGATIDSVFYDESWQNPNLYDTDGVALERIDPNGPSNDNSNWSSSTQVSGGTPGEQNSIFQESGAIPENVGISFTPNPFSPDDDGFEDNLFINYRLDEPDYLLRIRIFDRYGREVRELADGKQAGFEGSLIWDGLTDDGRRNRVGIYIVLFEAYNSANGKNRTFKETVVLARKF